MPYSVHSFNATKSLLSVGVLITKISLVVDASFISASAVTAFATTFFKKNFIIYKHNITNNIIFFKQVKYHRIRVRNHVL